MNSLIHLRRNEALNLLRLGSRKKGEVRFSSNETTEHRAMKELICADLRIEGKEYVTEAIFKTGGRADILVLDDFKVIEIAVTESEESLQNKAEKYPKGLKIEVIRCQRKK